MTAEPLVKIALDFLMSRVYDAVGDTAPIPRGFMEEVGELTSDLVLVMLRYGGKIPADFHDPYVQDMHELMRRYKLIETV